MVPFQVRRMLQLQPHESMRMRVMHAITPAPDLPPTETTVRSSPKQPASLSTQWPTQKSSAHYLAFTSGSVSREDSGTPFWSEPDAWTGNAAHSASARVDPRAAQPAVHPGAASEPSSPPAEGLATIPGLGSDPEAADASARSSESGGASLAGCFAVLEVDESNLSQAEALRERIGELVTSLGGQYHGTRTFKSGSVATLP